jgi:hypothetical protein
MTCLQQLEVDAHVLASSRLKSTSRGYKALKTLLEHGNLLYWCLGKNDTLELVKVLIYLQFRIEYVTGGIQLKPESKNQYYYLIMNRKEPLKPTYPHYPTLSVGKAESQEEKPGWNERRLMAK